MQTGLGTKALVLLTAVGLAWSVAGTFGSDEESKQTADVPAHLKGLTLLDARRHLLDQSISTLCIAPRNVRYGPHDKSTILVYANDKAIRYRRANAEAHDYPLGSVFLKEKYTDMETETPHLATVMRRTGSEGGIDDWDFSMVSLPDGKTVEMKANEKAACADCHEGFEKRGFVSRFTEGKMASLVDPANGAKAAPRPEPEK